MADATLTQLVRHARRLSGAESLSDGELLHAFVSGREQEAFAALARRHGPMVLNVCRRVLRHQQDAEDAFQATFLVLAKKAASVRNRPALACWLYGAAYRAALTLKRSAARRRAHEARATPPEAASPVNELAWREVEAILEEEIQRLPEKYRLVFVLCCLESEGRAEVARRLGLKEGTVSSRLDTARKRLQGQLARRGVTLSAVLAAAALARPAGAAVSLALLTATAQAAAAVAEGKVPAVSATVAGLAATTAWWKATAALALTLAVLAGWAGLAALHTPAEPRADGDRQAAPAVRNDGHGDPLPPGAVARLGTVRFRHGSTITGLAFTPDGKTLVSGSYDCTVRSWDPDTGRELVRLPSISGSAYDLALAADGNTVATVGYDALYVGDLKTGRLTKQTAARVDGRTCVALSPDGKLLAAQSAADTVGLWETASGKLLRECRGHKGKVARVAFTSDGQALASCGDDGTARLWDVGSGKETLLVRRKEGLNSVAVSQDGKHLATAGADGKLCLWALPGGKLLHEAGSGGLGLKAVAFSPDGKAVAATGGGHALHLYDRDTGKQIRLVYTNPHAVAFSPDGRTLAAGGSDCTIQLWDVATGKERPAAAGHAAPISAVAISNGGTVATLDWNRSARLWDAGGKELRRLKVNTAYLPRMALSPDGKVVASNFALWDSATGKELGRLKDQDRSVEAMAFSPDGRTLAMAGGYGNLGKGRSIRLRDAATLKEVGHFGSDTVHSLSYAPDGKSLAAGNLDGTVVVWDAATGREAWRTRGHQREVRSVAYSPDGAAVASCSFDGDMFLWDAATGKLLRPLVRQRDPRRGEHVHPLALAFAPNGKMLASAEGLYGDGASVTLWEVATGKTRLRLNGHQGDINALAFTPDGRSLVTTSTDTTALVWDVLGPPAPAVAPAAAWADLGSEDATRAYRAIRALAKSPDGVASLAKRLPPSATPDAGRVARLIKDLDSDSFADREKASQELEQLGEAAEPDLRKARADKPSTEARKRLDRLVEKLTSEWLRTGRALEAMELAGTPAAAKVLQVLAGGAPEARLTREAKAALARLRGGK